MKKIILLLSVVALVFTSCSSDDDGSSNNDPFVGNWQYYKYYENGVEMQLEPCEDETTFQILANGNFVTTFYVEGSNGNCMLEGSISGTWSNVGNGFYSTTVDGETETVEVIFDGNTFYFEDTYFDGTNTITYRDVFIKI